MEKYSEYLMWMRRKQVKPKLKQSSSMEDDDDEVVAWPPRSYTCSFCKREFRSAQALGGHMNVHRRDRAKLKQSNNSNIAAMAPPSSPPVSSATIFFQENYSGDHQKGCKRQRMISSSCSKTVSFMPVLHDPCLSSDKNSGMEDIDLELRVGVSPFVK